MTTKQIPNILSGSRYLAGLVCLLLVWHACWVAASVVIGLAVFSDLADGYLARRLNAVSPLGGLLDHSADAVFVTLALTGLALQAIITWWLPPLIIIAFSQYMLDSRAHRGYPLRASQLGRYNGIAYYVLAALGIGLQLTPFHESGNACLSFGAWLLVGTTTLSIVDRATARFR